MDDGATVPAHTQNSASAAQPDFIHLRVHTAYSLSESTLRIEKLASLAHEFTMPALAVTDSFNMFGAYEFSQKMAKSGIQPIIGASVFVKDSMGRGNLVLLAQSERGYMRLCQLISDALLETDPASEPVLSLEQLEMDTHGLIALSGGYRDGFLGYPAMQGQHEHLSRRAEWLAEHFGDRAYIEIQRHGHSYEAQSEPLLLDMADKTGLMLVATNDCHFDTPSMFVPQKVLSCIASSERLASQSDTGITSEHGFKSGAEMTALFGDIPEAIVNTSVIAKRCSYLVQDRPPILPSMAEGDEAEMLKELAQEGLKLRLDGLEDVPGSGFDGSDEAKSRYDERLNIELEIIISMGFSGYFLIVSDFIKWAKDNDIAVGPGRGSGAGSLVAWALLITDLDPLRWGLLFERFLNPERVSMPDFDIDFCQERREEVIRYVQQRYGKDRVAQIITFGTLQARAALRDVGRVLDMPYGQVDRIAKLVPSNPAHPVTISQALETEKPLQEMYKEEEQVTHLIDTAQKLEGLYRHASTHAAGLVIADRALPELVPLYRDPRSDMPVTQFNMKAVEQVGLVKFDFLGLKTLTVIERSLALLKRRDINIDISTIPLDDAKTFEMLTKGDTVGVFQLESSGMRDVLQGLKPDRFEDIIAVVALYRPGPMENIPLYINRKHGTEPVEYMHPFLEPILDETYGIMIYQEQVQQAARALAGYTLGGADILRRAMGKKIKEEMDQQREIFISGAADNQIDARLASDIFDQIASFAGYGFNKSHAAAYALVSYQTAWLKANYPVEFMAASMALDAGNTDKLALFRQDCLTQKIAVLPPDVNSSEASFMTEQTDEGLAIRYALGAVRNVGAEAMGSLVNERECNGAFKHLDDFAERLPREAANRKQLENLVKAGALDGLNQNRRQLMSSIDQILSLNELRRREAASDQVSLFSEATGTQTTERLRLEAGADWSSSERLSYEFDALGLYLSAHPLDSYAQQLDKMGVVSSAELDQALGSAEQKRIKLAGQKAAFTEGTSARGNRYAFVRFTDKAGSFETTLFSEVLQTSRPLLDGDNPVLVTADARRENGNIRLLCVRLNALDDAIAQTKAGLGIVISDVSCLEPIKQALRDDGAGGSPVKFFIMTPDGEVEITLGVRFQLSGDLRQKLKNISGISNLREIKA